MKTAYDYSDISKLVMSHVKPGAVTNNFLTKRDYVREIENRSLYYEDAPDGLVILRARNGYCRMNYSIHGQDLPRLGQDENIVTEHVFRPKDSVSGPEFLKQYGFKPLFDRIRMVREQGECGSPSGAVRFALPEEAGAVMAILKEIFDARTGCLPESDELLSAISGKNIVVAEYASEINGVLHFSEKSGSTELRHLAVRPECRRHGLAGSMVRFYINASGLARSLVWVRRDNTDALNFYSSCGYSLDGWTSRVYEKGK